ncbi:hypothetical protein BDZ45DRAFT_301483 [Acephala macrosclerotiorum]|nr:hypothetical protein BDZ45DRAFT_301483 [Acephala macrosclerotiorum]
MSKSDRMFLGLEHRGPGSDRRLLGHRNGFSRPYRLDRCLIFLLFECLLHSIIPSKCTASCEAYLVNSTFGGIVCYYIVEVENIPTSAELKMDCFHDSNELTFQLRTAQRGLVCISFVWEEITISAKG